MGSFIQGYSKDAAPAQAGPLNVSGVLPRSIRN